MAIIAEVSDGDANVSESELTIEQDKERTRSPIYVSNFLATTHAHGHTILPWKSFQGVCKLHRLTLVPGKVRPSLRGCTWTFSN